MSKDTCALLKDIPNVLPGWGCCKCRTYNGMQRFLCKYCGHPCCHPEVQEFHTQIKNQIEEKGN